MARSTRWWTLTLALAPALCGCTADDSFAEDGGAHASTDATLYDVPSFDVARPEAQAEGASSDASPDADGALDGATDAEGTADADAAD
jgi:hypothetical protein